jgi:DNA modification methylase
MSVRIMVGDALAMLKTLPSESVHCSISSPPYYSLRDYSAEGQIGLEPTPDAYIESLVRVYRELRRVMRHDGIVICNLGDSYAGSGKGPTGHNGIGDQERRQGFSSTSMTRNRPPHVAGARGDAWVPAPAGYKPKDLMMIPFRVAMALQQDGWTLRSVIPWLKRNAMPESVTDRPTTAVEYLFLFGKSARYFWDSEAVRVAGQEHPGLAGTFARPDSARGVALVPGNTASHRPDRDDRVPGGRSYRNSDAFFASWQGLMLDGDGDPLALVVNPQPYSGSHFATFPVGLVEPFVKAGTSERGCCSECGAPYRRVVERAQPPTVAPSEIDRYGNGTAGVHRKVGGQYQKWLDENPARTAGWTPTCAHDAEVRPCTVLDPFGGAGTTGLVADRLGRDAILIELSPEYAALARKRIEGDAPMFAEVTA